jgi:hypothetical protein
MSRNSGYETFYVAPVAEGPWIVLIENEKARRAKKHCETQEGILSAPACLTPNLCSSEAASSPPMQRNPRHIDQNDLKSAVSPTHSLNEEIDNERRLPARLVIEWQIQHNCPGGSAFCPTSFAMTISFSVNGRIKTVND